MGKLGWREAGRGIGMQLCGCDSTFLSWEECARRHPGLPRRTFQQHAHTRGAVMHDAAGLNKCAAAALLL